MAFLDFLKREDGSWNIGLIMALVVAALAVFGGGFAIYYTSYSRGRKPPRPAGNTPRFVRRVRPAREALKHFDKNPEPAVDLSRPLMLRDGKFYFPHLESAPKGFYSSYDSAEWPAVAKPMYPAPTGGL